MINLLKRVGNWFIGKAEELDKLDGEIKAIINVQTKRAFGLGVIVGILLTAVLIKLVG